MGTLVQLLALALSRRVFYEVIYMHLLALWQDLQETAGYFAFLILIGRGRPLILTCCMLHSFLAAETPGFCLVPFVSCQRPQSPHEADCSATDRQLTRVCVRRLRHICRSSKTKTAGRHGNRASNTAALSQRNWGGGHDCGPHSN